MLLDAVILLDAALPYLVAAAALLVLTGNFACRCFLEAAGFNLRQRQATGLFLVAASAAMLSGITSCHATTLIIMLLAMMTWSTWRRGGHRQALGSAAGAVMLVPLVLVS